jgi:hypothetical protein
MVNPLLADPWIAARIDEALAPYLGRLPASDVAWMREQLAETLSNDEEAASVLRAAMPRHVEQSGEVAKDGSAVESAPQAKKKAR